MERISEVDKTKTLLRILQSTQKQLKNTQWADKFNYIAHNVHLKVTLKLPRAFKRGISSHFNVNYHMQWYNRLSIRKDFYHSLCKNQENN